MSVNSTYTSDSKGTVYSSTVNNSIISDLNETKGADIIIHKMFLTNTTPGTSAKPAWVRCTPQE